MSDQDSLEMALDGLIKAVRYAEDIGEDELAREVSALYQKLADVSPEEHWDDVYRYKVYGNDIYEVVKDTDGVFIFDKEGVSQGIKVYATEDGRDRLKNISKISEVEILSEKN